MEAKKDPSRQAVRECVEKQTKAVNVDELTFLPKRSS